VFAALVSAVALIFAAIAAWGALRTVQLTRTMQIEQRVQRLGEALVGMIIAADEAQVTPPIAPMRTQAFDNAVHDLRRCTATSVRGLSTAVTEPIATLVNDREMWTTPTAAMYLAVEASRALKDETDDLLDPPPLIRLPWHR
jgi:hypothetical protein